MSFRGFLLRPEQPTAWPRPLFGKEMGCMRRVNQYQFYQLGATIHPLTTFTDQMKFGDIWLDCVSAQQWIRMLLADSLTPLVTCRTAARKLEEALDVITTEFGGSPGPTAEQYNEKMASPLNWYEVHQIASAAREFEYVFAAELETTDTYYVSEKGIYSTNRLIETAERVFSAEVLGELSSQAINDIRQAGKCLAFDLDTACGFHIVRATETLIHKYYCAVTQSQPKRKDRNWGAYVRNLNRHRNQNSSSGVDPKLVALIDQVREHHRNPVMHPEITLNTDEAQSMFSICQAVIITLANGLRALPGAQLPLKAVGGP